MTEFLLEINTEEMPSSHVKAGLSQLKENIGAGLTARRIAAGAIETMGSCRRLVVRGDFAPRQEDTEETVIGPPKAAAFGPDGAPAAAARGFAKAQGVELGALRVIETPRGLYIGVTKRVAGVSTSELLAGMLPGIITSLTFPKMMKWGECPLRFSRPIKNILCLLGNKPIAFSVEALEAGDRTSGHRLHAPRRFKIRPIARETVFEAYTRQLRERLVILRADERKRIILEQAGAKLAAIGAELYPDEELLEKLSYDVEWPSLILGGFPAEYLDLPIEVLSMAMREGQKLFSVVKDGRQLPRFIGVTDTPGDPESVIQRGNERVLRARLEDARFFWQQDRKMPLAERRAGLACVVFQQRLGSYADKTERLQEFVGDLCEELGLDAGKPEAVLAAGLSKVDLITEMVREFPALQGKMGGLYAQAEGYPETVWRAVYEHYQPVSFDDRLPGTTAGALLSLADKLDSIVGVIGLGIQVTGSSDPFGLRRNALGVARIILDRGLTLSFRDLIDRAAARFEKDKKQELSRKEVVEACLGFFEQRLRYIFETGGFRYDLVNAALAAGLDNLHFCRLKLEALDALKKTAEFTALILMAKRVNNILREVPPSAVEPGLFSEPAEKQLFASFSRTAAAARPMIAAGDFTGAQSEILSLGPPLSMFFERVHVMAEDLGVRRNRLALLQAIRDLLWDVADYSLIVVEGEKTA
jgi:glycyl-tRNA synthetase beta chain